MSAPIERHVDPNKVIQFLKGQLGEAQLQMAILNVAYEELGNEYLVLREKCDRLEKSSD